MLNPLGASPSLATRGAGRPTRGVVTEPPAAGDALDATRKFVAARPTASLVVAVAAGLTIGWWLKK